MLQNKIWKLNFISLAYVPNHRAREMTGYILVLSICLAAVKNLSVPVINSIWSM